LWGSTSVKSATKENFKRAKALLAVHSPVMLPFAKKILKTAGVFSRNSAKLKT